MNNFVTTYPLLIAATYRAFSCYVCNADLDFGDEELAYATIYYCRRCGSMVCEAHTIGTLCYGCFLESAK